MTRNKRIAKLGNAIQEFRGSYHSVSKKWIRTPNTTKWDNIVKWSESLGLDPYEVLNTVRDFQSFDEYRTWIGNI